MPYGRLKKLCRSLRFRVTAWNTGVVLAMTIATFVGVNQVLRHTLVQEFDHILREDLLEIDLMVRQVYPNSQQLTKELNRKAQSHSHRGWFVQLFDGDGKVRWSSDSAPENASQLMFGPPRPERATPFTWQHFRILEWRIGTPGKTQLMARVGSSMVSLEEDMALVRRTTLISGLVIVVLTPLVGYWLAGRGIRPLAQMIHTASRLRPDNLSDRLPARPTGDELEQLAHTVNGLLDRIAAYLDQKRDFIANAAHELRSPLAAIRSSVDVALNVSRSPEEYTELLLEIEEVCAGLSSLVNQLLVLTESDAGKLFADSVNVAFDQVVTKSLAMFEGLAESQEISLVCRQLEPAIVRGHENHLRQIVNNLIDNAIKFTPPGGRVEVTLRALGDQHQAMLSVRDTGAGIPADDLPHIFERFFRGDRSRRRTGAGSGLGLSICRSIVTAYQGEIEAASELGRGTRVTVFLPLCAVTATGVASPVSNAR